jgi:hypothetical protein
LTLFGPTVGQGRCARGPQSAEPHWPLDHLDRSQRPECWPPVISTVVVAETVYGPQVKPARVSRRRPRVGTFGDSGLNGVRLEPPLRREPRYARNRNKQVGTSRQITPASEPLCTYEFQEARRRRRREARRPARQSPLCALHSPTVARKPVFFEQKASRRMALHWVTGRARCAIRRRFATVSPAVRSTSISPLRHNPAVRESQPPSLASYRGCSWRLVPAVWLCGPVPFCRPTMAFE